MDTRQWKRDRRESAKKLNAGSRFFCYFFTRPVDNKPYRNSRIKRLNRLVRIKVIIREINNGWVDPIFSQFCSTRLDRWFFFKRLAVCDFWLGLKCFNNFMLIRRVSRCSKPQMNYVIVIHSNRICYPRRSSRRRTKPDDAGSCSLESQSTLGSSVIMTLDSSIDLLHFYTRDAFVVQVTLVCP